MPKEIMEDVDQEKINTQKAIYDINQRLNLLFSQLSELSIKCDKNMAILSSEINTLRIDLENHKREINEIVHENSQKIGDNFSEFKKIERELDGKISRLNFLKLDSDAYSDGFQNLAEQIGYTNQKIEKKQDFFNETVRDLRNHIAEQCAILRKDLIVVEPEVDPLQKAIEDQLLAFRLDVKGYNKELILLKKHKAYNDKKFEHIYTLIERLKGAK